MKVRELIEWCKEEIKDMNDKGYEGVEEIEMFQEIIKRLEEYDELRELIKKNEELMVNVVRNLKRGKV